MNTLENHTLLYDKECPLCNFYTAGFIRANMLDKNGRQPFNQLKSLKIKNIDVQRATNEIALVDTKTNKVIYGIDSLLKVIGNSFPLVEKIGNVKPIYFLLQKLYSFISYNRKVIIPAELKKKEELVCEPDFNVKYRLLFIVLSIGITFYSLRYFSPLIKNLPSLSLTGEFLLAIGQIVFQSLFFLGKNTKTTINYIGNLMTVSLFGSLGLLQLILLNAIITLPQFIVLSSFFGIVSFMFFEHKRRLKLLELPSYLSYTWILYRIIVLLILLNI
ncbi:conserved membrane hypothetical protein [Tenacibaculum sp. 190524A02b]|uniref:DUF393 domain-containing protein n=1 Tax=Tenacibaculum vairaonense TaxID=3137860 RepID=A0ABP1F3X9_9FLAO